MFSRASNSIIEKIKNTILFSYAPRWVVLLIDIVFSFVAIGLAWLILYQFQIENISRSLLLVSFLLFMTVRSVSFLIGKTYTGIVRHTGHEDTIRIFVVLTVGEGVILALNLALLYFAPTLFIPISILIAEYVILMFLMVISRLVFKAIFEQGITRGKKHVAVYGSDENALIVKRVMESAEDVPNRVVAFIDDDTKAVGKALDGVTIYNEEALEKTLVYHKIDKLVFAKKDIPKKRKRSIVNLCLKYNVSVLEAPNIEGWASGNLNTKRIKEIQIEELLGRGEIQTDHGVLKQQLVGKVVLVTGAAGSIGSEIVRQLIEFKPSSIILFDQAETPLYDIELELKQERHFNSCHIEIGDIRDFERIESIFKTYEPQVVYHAAAYKHVPMMESHPQEGVKTNVFGTKNVADCAARYGAECFVMVSTDKAVNPTNVMGASKRIAEIYTQSLNSVVKTKFITTRFGNVLGSNGSVVHRFRKQIAEGGPLTITHPEITRFFMTITEACQLVLQAGALGGGGEIFIFDMGESVKIVDLARQMVKLSGLQLGTDIQISYTGLRPGEKLYEEVLNIKEITIPTKHDKIKVAKVRQYNYSEVQQEMEILRGKLNSYDDAIIVRQMKLIVPEFKSQNSEFETLDTQLSREIQETIINEVPLPS